jgi:TonB-dependent SusC/RagA subfamily outer membrane receptor
MKKIMIILIVILGSIRLSAQPVIVSGKVTGFNKYPFKNIKVSAKKAKTAILTDEYGNFSIACLPNDVLIFESKSCNKKTYKITNPNDSVKVNLIFKNTPESKEYAVGYGIISENDLVYAISNLSNDDNNFGIYTDMYALLKGKFPSITIQGTSIIIRGTNSILGSSDALLVVDGIIVSDLSSITPNTVKSVDILKDASSSMYGSQGANGVVLITTKKGME